MSHKDLLQILIDMNVDLPTGVYVVLCISGDKKVAGKIFYSGQ
jgi:hypothetical protein